MYMDQYVYYVSRSTCSESRRYRGQCAFLFSNGTILKQFNFLAWKNQAYFSVFNSTVIVPAPDNSYVLSMYEHVICLQIMIFVNVTNGFDLKNYTITDDFEPGYHLLRAYGWTRYPLSSVVSLLYLILCVYTCCLRVAFHVLLVIL